MRTTLALATLATAAPSSHGPAGENMNGAYTIANPKAGDKPFSTDNKDYPGGVEYFDVYTPEISTRYSQVWWTMMQSVPLPDELIQRFDGKVMAVTGMETDQVMKTKDGDVSVPITWAYNHHYGAYLNGKDSVLEKIKLDTASGKPDPRNFMGHAMPNDEMWITRPSDTDSNPDSRFPASTVWAEGNGGEFRKRSSIHSLVVPYAQLIASVVLYAQLPLLPGPVRATDRVADQLGDDPDADRHLEQERLDGEAGYALQVRAVSMNRNTQPHPHPHHPVAHALHSPGPHPKQYEAPTTGPDAIYSGLLECPCTDRITRRLGGGGAGSTQLEGQCARPLQTASACRAAAAALAKAAPNTSSWASAGAHAGCLPFEFATGDSGAKPPGCSLATSAAAASGYFNTRAAGPAMPLCGGAPGEQRVSGALGLELDGGEVGTDGHVRVALSLDAASGNATITLTGPASAWFGIGFGANAMVGHRAGSGRGRGSGGRTDAIPPYARRRSRTPWSWTAPPALSASASSPTTSPAAYCSRRCTPSPPPSPTARAW